MEKTDVNGDETHPLYKFMKQNSSIKGSDIEWNFTYFLLDRFGRVQDVVGPK
jgi:glutathione peroxidase